jgi:hypothetical protein
MSIELALEWLRGPLLGIEGVIDIVSSFIFQFKGVQVRELARESDLSCINCITCLSDGWAVGDEAGNIGVYDQQCEQLLRTYHHPSPVRTIAAFGAGNGFVFNQTLGMVYRQNEETEGFCSRDGNQVFKLVTFSDGLVVSCSKITTSVHVYITWRQPSLKFYFMHSMTGKHRAADIMQCGGLLASVHQTMISGPKTEVWLWDVRRGLHLYTFPLTCSYICDAISLTDDTMVFIDTSFRVHMCNATKGYEAGKAAYNMCAVPDGWFLTTRLHNDNFYMLSSDIQSEVIVPNKNQAAIPDCHMSRILYVPSGHVVVCQENRKLVVWK